MADQTDPEGMCLEGDANRQASDSIRGYAFQIWHSVLAWLDLTDEEVLILEGAEDIDIMAPGSATTIQVKDIKKNVTLRSDCVLKAISNYWRLRRQSTARLRFRFLTTAQRGVEDEQPFGAGRPGLSVWEESANSIDLADQLRWFLVTDGRISNEHLSSFLQTATCEEVQDQLFQPMLWETARPKAVAVEEAIRHKLVVHGDRYGVQPTPAAKVVYRLLKDAWQTAASDTPRPLTRVGFLEVFEQETTIPMPVGDVARMFGLLSTAGHAANATGAVSMTALVVTEPPPLVGECARRHKLIENCLSALEVRGLLILHGSTGIGKSTIAKLLALQSERTWRWLSLCNIKAEHSEAALHLLAGQVETMECNSALVIDGFEHRPNQPSNAGERLCGLLFLLLSRGIRVVVTSQRSFGARWTRSLGLGDDCNIEIPRFDLADLVELSRSMGCEDEPLAQQWAGLIHMQTGGHPQLVHARMISLARNGWPKPTVGGFLQQPEEVTEERQSARGILLSQATDEQRELLYRLSVLLGYFRRDQALAIAGIDPFIAHPGDAFDPLVGPWVEGVAHGYYRLSPLLTGAGSDVWPDDRVRALRAGCAAAILRCPQLTLIEAGEILFQSLMSGSGETALAVAHPLILAADDAMARAATEMPWLPLWSVKTGRSALPGNPLVSSTVRNLQFRMATAARPDLVSDIADEWLAEPVDGLPEGIAATQRFLTVSQICLYHEALSGKQLTGLLEELAGLECRAAALEPGILPVLPKMPEGGTSDVVTEAFRIAVFRNARPNFLLELVKAVSAIERGLKNRMLRAFESRPEDARLLIDRTWMREAHKEDTDQDWDSCIEALKAASVCADEWGLTEMSAAAAAAVSVIYDEYLDDEVMSIEVLEEAECRLGHQRILDEQKATVALNRKRYGDAVSLWEPLFPSGSGASTGDDLRSILSCRKAGVAAGYTEDWRRAAEFFWTAGEYAKDSQHTLNAAGLAADEGYCRFRAGDLGEAVDSLHRSLLRLDELPDIHGDLGSLTVAKKVGHVMLWVSTSLSGETPESLATPPPGMCSDPETREEFRDLPRSPVVGSWVLLAEAEYWTARGRALFDEAETRLAANRFVLFESIMAVLDVRHSLRAGDPSFAVDQTIRLNRAMAALKRTRDTGGDAMGLALRDTEYEGYSFNPGVLPAFLLALAGRGEDVARHPVLETWEASLKTSVWQNELGAWLSLARQVLAMQPQAAQSLVGHPGDNHEKRTLADIYVASSNLISPQGSFCAHLDLYQWIHHQLFTDELADYLVFIVQNQWLRHSNNPAALKSPRLTVPQIRATCETSLPARKKIGQILLAARHAVSVSLPDGLLEELRERAS